MSYIENIETELNNFLLRDIAFILDNGKILRKGKLILFRFKEFHFNFTLKNDKGDHKIYEIPYPFNYKANRDSIEFSYEFNDFTLIDSDLFYKVKTTNNKTANKLYNSVVVLSGT
jgi:hypothetical protein